MIHFKPHSSAERQSRTRGPANMQIDDSIAASEDLLFDFFDFFDSTIDQVYTYILHRTRMPGVAEEITLDVYFSLLQRRRFLWWRNIAEISTLLPVAEKAIAAMPKWSEKKIDEAYMEELKQCVPDSDEEATVKKLEAVLETINGFPVKEQRVAAMRFFLHWKPKKVAEIVEKSVSDVEKMYETVLHKLIHLLGEKDVFQEVSVEKFLEKISCPPLAADKKANLRVALLERYRAGQMSNVRFVAPVAAMLLFVTVGSYTAFSTFMLPPVSGQGTVQQVAALEVLYLEKEMEMRDTFLVTDREYRTYTAYYAEKDLARIAVDLLPPALRQQIALENDVNDALKDMGSQSLVISSLFSIAKAYAQSP